MQLGGARGRRLWHLSPQKQHRQIRQMQLSLGTLLKLGGGVGVFGWFCSFFFNISCCLDSLQSFRSALSSANLVRAVRETPFLPCGLVLAGVLSIPRMYLLCVQVSHISWSKLLFFSVCVCLKRGELCQGDAQSCRSSPVLPGIDALLYSY